MFSEKLLKALNTDFEQVETIDLKEVEEFILKSPPLPHVLVKYHSSNGI